MAVEGKQIACLITLKGEVVKSDQYVLARVTYVRGKRAAFYGFATVESIGSEVMLRLRPGDQLFFDQSRHRFMERTPDDDMVFDPRPPYGWERYSLEPKNGELIVALPRPSTNPGHWPYSYYWASARYPSSDEDDDFPVWDNNDDPLD